MRVFLTTGLMSLAFCVGSATAQQADRPDQQPAARREAAGGQDQPRTNGRESEPGRAENADQAMSKDRMFAQMLAIDNAAEAQISENAAEHLQHKQVKRFAAQMVEEHRQMLQQLEQMGATTVSFEKARQHRGQPHGQQSEGDRATTQPGTRSEQTDSAPRTSNQPNEATQRGRQSAREENRQEGSNRGPREEAVGADANPMQFAAIHQEIAELCIQSAQDELASKSGREADRCYMMGQVFGHQKMVDCLTVLERHASPKLAETLAQATRTTKQHLAEAKEIAKLLESQETDASTRPDASSGSREPRQR